MVKQLGADVELPAAIRAVFQQLIDAGLAASGEEINSGAACGGNCDRFIALVYRELGGIERAYALGVQEMGIQGLLQFDPDDNGANDGKPFDRELIEQYWPKVVPPAGLSWDDMDRLSADASFSVGTHVWLYSGARHFDCECPDGVENPIDLPYFQRAICSWQMDTLPRGRATHVLIS